MSSDPVDFTFEFNKTVTEEPSIQLERLRRECPVAHVRDDGRFRNYWAVMRHDDVMQVLRQPDVFVNNGHDRLRTRRPPLESDPPEHPQVRKLLQPFFAAKRLEAFEPVSRRLALDLIEPLLASGEGDAAAAIARPLPPQVLLTIFNQPKEDWATIKRWSENSFLERSTEPGDKALFKEADDSLWAYARAAVEDRKRKPRDPNEDPITAMLVGQVDGAPMNEDLVAGTTRLFLAAGHDSTTSTVGTCIQYLAANQEDQRRLRADPALIPAAVEEILRFATPVLSMPRTVARDVELRGRQLKAGDTMRLFFASANRDPEAFDDPDTCIIDRQRARHVSFGFGIHMCIGAPLARQEVRVALEELLARTERFELAGKPEMQFWHPNAPLKLPLRLVTKNR
jgi:cytochrome P450